MNNFCVGYNAINQDASFELSAGDVCCRCTVCWRLCIVAKRQYRSMVNVCNWRHLILQTELTRTLTVMTPGKRFFEVLCALKHDSPVCSWCEMTLRELWHGIIIKICAVALMHLSSNWFDVVVGAVKCHAVCVWSWFDVGFFCVCLCVPGIYLQNKFWWFMADKLILPPGWAVNQDLSFMQNGENRMCLMLKKSLLSFNLGINRGKIYHYRQQWMIQRNCPKGNCRIKTHRLIPN